MQRALVSLLFSCLALSLIACGESSSGETSTSTGGDSCSLPTQDAAAVACSALVQVRGAGLSKPFKSGTLTDVKPDGATIDAGADGMVSLAWAGDDLTTVFAVGDAVTGVGDGPHTKDGYTGIESPKERAVVGYASINTGVPAPMPFALAPELSFSLAPECASSACEPICPGAQITTTRSSLVITASGAKTTLKTGETGTVAGVIVHHGGASEGSARSVPSGCNLDFLNETTWTLLQKLP